MEKMISIRKYFLQLFFLSAALAVSVSSCKKEEENGGNESPVISKIYTPTNRETGLTTGALNQWLIISGSNLSGTQSVAFNDVVVQPENFFANDTSVTIRIPRQLPGSVNDKVTVTTNYGTTTYDFKVVIPQLLVTDMANEYVNAGDTLEILGDYFDLYGLDTSATTVTFAGDKTTNVVASSASSLKVIVPADVQPGALKITGPAPVNTSVTTTAWYKDNRNFLFDMSAYNGWNGASFLSSGADPAPLNGPYFKVAKSWQGGWAWDPFCSNNCNIPEALVNDASQYKNYALKFEMYTPASTPALPTKLYMCFNTGGFKDYFFDPSASGNFPYSTKGVWRTFSVPLKDWGNLDGFTFKSSMIMEFMLKDANPGESNFSICNFRIVPL